MANERLFRRRQRAIERLSTRGNALLQAFVMAQCNFSGGPPLWSLGRFGDVDFERGLAHATPPMCLDVKRSVSIFSLDVKIY
jgi:hypothetical protein